MRRIHETYIQIPTRSNMVELIAEIGINHNGDINLCKKLIAVAASAGFQYAKIQKRNPDVCVPDHMKSKQRETPWGVMSYLDYKHRIEFSFTQVKELKEFADEIGIKLFASVWDHDSVDQMAKLFDVGKIPSALITNIDLCTHAREKFETLIISTGMSTEEEIEACVDACSPDVVMHTNSTYPCPYSDLNLRYIEHLEHKYTGKEIGYSGHEYGLVTTYAAVTMGVSWVERHVTLDRTMWGSDQASSIEPDGMFKLVRGVRAIESATQYPPGPRRQFDTESSKRESLRSK